MEEGTTSLSLTQKKRQHERKMGASVRTIKANVPTFVPTTASQSTFVFDDSNVDNDDNNVSNQDVFL